MPVERADLGARDAGPARGRHDVLPAAEHDPAEAKRVRALRAGFRVREVPILFRDRRVGASKMSARIAVEAFWKVPLLRFRVR